MLLEDDLSIAFGILNWKKPHTPEIIKALARQTACPSIRVWNNNPEYRFAERYPEAAQHCDVIIDSSVNLKCGVFATLFEDCETQFIGKIDDDIMLADVNVVQDCLEYMKNQDHDRILGGHGVVLEPAKPYKYCEHWASPPKEDVPADIVISRFWIMRKSALWKAPRDVTHHHGDISLCGFLANGRERFHIMPGLLHNRLWAMEENDLGAWTQPGHFEAREKIRSEWFH